MDFDKYVNKMSYPARPVKPSAVGIKNAQNAKDFAQAYEKYEAEIKTYQQKWDAYQVEEANLCNQFRTDALEEVGLTGHPKADKAFAYAWEQGHSDGYPEVFNVLLEVVDLIL
jgi:hypothetical protein